MMSSQVLHESYERLHRTGPEFGGDEEGNNGLSNHGPMAVEVLVRRGHDLDVPRWVDAYLPRLEELPRASDRVTDETWRDALGQRPPDRRLDGVLHQAGHRASLA
jgi:hypothetical protein